jgi:hypothetical protein
MVALFLNCFCVGSLVLADQPEVAPMNNSSSELADQAGKDTWDRFYTAQVHIRYHQGFARYYGSWDRAARLSILLISLVSLSAPYVFAQRSAIAKRALYIVALFSLAGSIAVNVYPLNDWHQEHAVLARQWNTLADKWDRLRRDRHNVSQSEFRVHWDQLVAEERHIENSEPPGPDEDFLEQCEQKTKRRFPNPPEAQPNMYMASNVK